MIPWHSLEGKTIWVTGGAGYLGSAITEELDRVAGKVICVDLPGKADALIADKKLKRTLGAGFNLTDSDALGAFISETLAKHGPPDGLVHMTFASSIGKTLEQLDEADFQKTLNHSLPHTFTLCRAVAEAMKSQNRGSIVLFSSMYGVVTPDKNIYHPPMVTNPIDYGVSKAALLQMTRYFAMHYGPSGIRFNSITPGPFPNPGVQEKYPSFIGDLSKKTLLNRVGQNPEIVGPVLFLLTDSASFVTGHTLAVDGGWTAW